MKDEVIFKNVERWIFIFYKFLLISFSIKVKKNIFRKINKA